MIDYLAAAFPQLDIKQVFPAEEIADLMRSKPGQFPEPQYSPKVHAEVGFVGGGTTCVLLGDAAHSFPPDLGLGVNSALQDVYLLGEELKAVEGDTARAASIYEKARLPEARALTRLVRSVFPYQYNHVPWRFNLSMIKLLTQMGLSLIHI